MATYVLIPGGWSGGWQWKAVADYLTAAGHAVYRVTLTGLGERVHLANPDVGLHTHIRDVVNTFEYELLTNVILVGYSYSGMVITGVAEQIPDRIQQLVYVDAFVPENGDSLATMVAPDFADAVRQVADAYGNGWYVPHDPPDADRRTPQPVKTFTETVQVNNALAATLPRTFIECTVRGEANPGFIPILAAGERARTSSDWRYRTIDAEHGNFWETHPREAADLLLELA